MANAALVQTDGARPVARVGLQPHEGSVSDLLERLESHSDPAVLDGRLEVAHLSPTCYQLVAEFYALATQPLALGEHPVVVHPRQQIAAIFLNRRCTMLKHRVLVAGHQRLHCQLTLTEEHAGVDPTRRPLSPHQCGRLNDERRIVTEQHAQMMQLPSQVRPRLPLSRIGPEDGGQTLPRLGRVGVDSKEAEQCDGARRMCEVRRGRSFDVLLPEK